MQRLLKCVAAEAGSKGRGNFSCEDVSAGETVHVEKDFFTKNTNHSCDANIKFVVDWDKQGEQGDNDNQMISVTCFK
jgi:hypothetical protein